MKLLSLLACLLMLGCNKGTPDPSQKPELPTSMTQKPLPFKEGLWIKKYPGENTCFKFETPAGIRIVTDPYGLSETIEPTLVTVSHDHYDHNDFSRIKGNYQVINSVGRFLESGVTITGIAGIHNKDSMIRNNIYIFELQDMRIAQFASQGDLPTEGMYQEIGEVDLVIIQGYHYNPTKLSVPDVRDIIARLKPKIVIPAHGDRSTGRELALLTGAEHVELFQGELIITKRDLVEMPGLKILVLDH